ncbi:MAG: TetR/AcrR family transcriptional regulator [Flavobacteriales bacterium]
MTKKDLTTANKIKETARRLFTEKGYGRITTRDIAKEADVNLALVNYYFRSKDELFHTIMFEVIQGFMGQMVVLMNDDHSFEEKLELVVSNYIDLLSEQPNLPIFMMSEIRNHPQEMAERLGIAKMIREAKFFKELAERCPEGVPPIQFFMNILSLTVFPFMGKPMIEAATGMEQQQFNMTMQMRKKLIPQWILGMLNPPKQ